MTTPQQTLERAYAALNAAAFAHPSASDSIGTQCSEAAEEIRALLAQQAAAPPAPGGDVLRHLADWFAHRRYDLYDGEFVAREIRRAIAEDSAYLQSTQGQDAAPAEQPQAVELLDERGEIRRDLKGSAYCVGNEYKPFHPSASHVRPEWRDGWNACFVAAIRAARAKE